MDAGVQMAFSFLYLRPRSFGMVLTQPQWVFPLFLNTLKPLSSSQQEMCFHGDHKSKDVHN